MGVSAENQFLFPSMRGGSFHCRGWDCVSSICAAAGVQSRITATKVRHRASTFFASLSVDASVEDKFLKHMGHSKSVSEDVYRCPPGVAEVTEIGRIFRQLDGAYYFQ